MKHLLFAFALLCSLTVFSQAKPIKDHLPVSAVAPSKGTVINIQTQPQTTPDQFVIMLSAEGLNQLYQLIENADWFSDKGRKAYLENVLKPKVFLLPKDTTKGK